MLPHVKMLLALLLVSVCGVFPYMEEGKAADWLVPTQREEVDPRIPLLDVKHPTGNGARGSAVLIAMDDDQAWYITNHHMTPYGSRAKYTLIAGEHRYPAEFVKHDRSLDLGLLVADRPADGVKPLLVAPQHPELRAPVGIHGWTHGRYFSFQEGAYLGYNNGWCRIGAGANQGQSGGAFISDGYVVGITSRTDQRTTSGANIDGIRSFLNW